MEPLLNRSRRRRKVSHSLLVARRGSCWEDMTLENILNGMLVFY